MENYQNIRELFTKYLDNSISRDEYYLLLRYFGKHKDDGELDQLVTEALSNDNTEYDSVRLGKVVDAVAYRLREKLQPKKTILFGKYLPYAAAVLLFFAATAYYFIPINNTLKGNHSAAIADVQPGHSAATLTLANGKKILLNDVSSGDIAKESGISVSKTKEGKLIYIVSPSNGSNGYSGTYVNTLSTARGETYQIVLSDGTKVWLNAATTLQYSVNLRERGMRKVKLLAGEAYFEVSKDKAHPFIVETAKQQVEVLGTHFNINSYADEGRVVTTLEEGSVEVSALHEAQGVTLKPGQQSLFVNGNMNVREADLQSALAWRDGKIYFRDAPLDEVLRQISRWYNIEVKYEGVPSKEVFNGGIKRSSNLSAVLRILELSNVHFNLEKKNNSTILTVMQDK